MRRFVQKIEFYITNVCNLTCSNCNRFNDQDFRGHQLWKDYERDYQHWAKKLDIQGLVILGGEPMLNPSICDWVLGLNRCFGRGVQVLTNGTRLNQVRGFYDALCNFDDGTWRNWVGISVHNRQDLDRFFEEATKFLRGPIRTFHGKDAKLDNGNSASYGADYTFVDENNVAVRLWLQDEFFPAAIQRDQPIWMDGKLVPGKYRVYDNDPVAAHSACGFATWKNYHMIRGKLHKCGPCVLMAEFDQQHPLDISAENREILRSYQALSAWDDDNVTDRFFELLDQPISQCKFCPTHEDQHRIKIKAVHKGRDAVSSFK